MPDQNLEQHHLVPHARSKSRQQERVPYNMKEYRA